MSKIQQFCVIAEEDKTSKIQRFCVIAEEDKTIDAGTPSNVLGIYWNATTDQLSLIPKIAEPVISKLTTKQEVLRESSKVFDSM